MKSVKRGYFKGIGHVEIIEIIKVFFGLQKNKETGGDLDSS